MRYNRGKAAAHKCSWCDNQARHWAQLHDTDGTDMWTHYIPLCFKCHMQYDHGGQPRPEEVRRKISEAKRRNPAPPRAHTAEERQMISDGQRGHTVSPETRQKIKAGLAGRTRTAEEKAAMSAGVRAAYARTGGKWSPARRAAHEKRLREKAENVRLDC